MKTRLTIITTILLVFLAGCTFQMGNLIVDVEEGELEVIRITVHAIGPPRVNGLPIGYNGSVIPGNRVKLDWATARDTYGNPAGLSDDRLCELFEVIITLPERGGTEETIFWPVRNGQPSPPNLVHWFPGHQPEIEPFSGLPYPPMFVAGYPHDACDGVTIVGMAGQVGTIVAIARVTVVRVRVVCPEHEEDGRYVFNIPASIPQESNVIEYNFAEAGTYEIIFEPDGGGDPTIHEFEVPEDWFWLRGEWPISISPTGVSCQSLTEVMK